MPRLLIADDNAASRDLLRFVLRAPGREILLAPDGAEALAVIERARPDLVLLDIQMPGLDGYGIIARLRQDLRFTSLPVIAVTAQAMLGEREKSLAAGFDEYIAKPVDARTLRRAVEKLLTETHANE